MTTYHTTVSLCVDDTVSEMRAEVSYTYHQATQGRREAGVQMEPDYDAYCVLRGVEATYLTGRLQPVTVDLLPLLSKDAVIELEARCLQHEREEAESAETDRQVAELEAV